MTRRREWATQIGLLGLVACSPSPQDSAPESFERPLVVALPGEPASLDPHLQDELYASTVLANVYERLVEFDAELRLRPGLAQRWENPDDLTWVFALRPGARFHDGRPVEAADVVASLDRARQHPRSRVSGYLIEVESARALDSDHVEVRTARPYPILLNKLSFVAVVPRDAPEEITKPIGSGPYRLVATDPGRVRFAWRLDQGAPPGTYPRADLTVVLDEQARLDLVARNEVDVSPVSAAARGVVDAMRGVRLATISSLTVLYLQVPWDRGPFADPRVRRAVHLAVDRDALVEDLFGGAGEAASQLVSPQVFGFSPDIEVPTRDVAAARALLAEAGYPDGLDFVLEVREGREIGGLAAQLAEVGLRAEVRASRWSELYPRLARGEVEAYLGAWQCSSGDASDLFDNRLHSRDPARGYGDANASGYANVRLDELTEESATTFAMGERRRILEQAMKVAMDDLPLIPLVVPYDSWAVRESIQWRPRLGGLVLLGEMRRAGGGR
jgi:peptide/nickel transport system substrate-binding protein